MKLWWGLPFALLAASSSGAATLDVSADTSVVVRTGDELVFHLLTSNFGESAAQFNLSRSPSQLNFAFVSAPVASAGSFDFTLESADRTVSIGSGELKFHSGYFQAETFSGEVSTLEGFLPLLPDKGSDEEDLVLTLRNEGPDIRLGLPPYLVRQDLYASLSGGPLSVGTVAYLVDLESRDSDWPTRLARVASSAATTGIPEPDSGGLLLGGGVLLCWVGAARGRMSRVAPKRR
jgi:hypothetical protein